MRVLYITPFKPSFKSGGEITVFNNLNILSSIVDTIDYVGFEYDKNIFDSKTLKKISNYYIKSKSKFINKVFSFFDMYSVSSYIKEYKNIIYYLCNNYYYDTVFIETTRLGSLMFLFKDIYTIINVHNIELDYFRDTRNKLFYNLLKLKIFNSEHISLINANKILYLTEKELKKFIKIYKLQNYIGKFVWNPVTYKEIKDISYNPIERDFIIFTGNFDYIANYKAALNLINLDIQQKIMIVGKNAFKLKSHVYRKRNYQLVNNPSDEELNYLMAKAKAFLSPVESGAGMKVKIVEAMSYKLPIIAHINSLNGYENCNSILRYTNKQELLNIVNNLDQKNLVDISKQTFYEFKKYFSYDVVKKRYERILNESRNNSNH